MTRGRRALALLLLLAALLLVGLGQFYFFHRPDYLWDGLVFHAAAAACFLLAWRQVRSKRPRRARQWLGPWLQQQAVPVGLVGLGLLLSLVATLLAQGRALDQPSGAAVLPWLLGCGALGLAIAWPTVRPTPPLRLALARWRRVSRQAWLEAATVAALTALALLLRATALDSVPYTLGGDEAWHGLLARQVLSGQVRNPFVMGYMSMPTFFYWPLSWSLRLVGNTMAGLRFPAALVGTATVPLLYFLARDLWGRRLALLSALFLAAYDYHIHYSRLGANNIWDPFFVLLALWLLHRGLVARPSRGAVPLEQMEIASPQDVILAKAGMTAARNDVENQGPAPAKAQGPVPGAVLAGPTVLPGSEGCRFLLAAGLVLGLSFYFYTGARLLPLLMAAYVAFVWLQNRLQVRRLRRQPVEGLGRHLALLVAAFVVVAGPMLGYALTHPDEWNARINQVGIIQSGWLAREPGLTGKSTLQILAEQFLRSAGAFHVFPDRTAWYGSPRPLLGFVAGAFALLGLAWALAHWRERRHFLVLIWFWSVIITGGMLTESPPSSQRLVIAIPAVALFVALGLEQTARLARRLLGADRLRIGRIEIGPISIGPVKGENLALGLIVALMAVSSVRFYFVDFSRSGRYGSQNGETATMIGHYLQELDGGYQAYFFGAPRIYWSFGTMTFLAPDVPGQDVVEPLAAPPAFGEEGRQAVYIFLPERSGELDWVQQAYPGGTRRDFYDATGTVRFTVYRVSTPIHTP